MEAGGTNSPVAIAAGTNELFHRVASKRGFLAGPLVALLLGRILSVSFLVTVGQPGAAGQPSGQDVSDATLTRH